MWREKLWREGKHRGKRVAEREEVKKEVERGEIKGKAVEFDGRGGVGTFKDR